MEFGGSSFLNPVIGLWPKDPTFGKTGVIGLDDPAARLRSIGATQTNAVVASTTADYDPGSDDGTDAVVMSVSYSVSVVQTEIDFAEQQIGTTTVPAYSIQKFVQTNTQTKSATGATGRNIGAGYGYPETSEFGGGVWWTVGGGNSGAVPPGAALSPQQLAQLTVDQLTGGEPAGPFPTPAGETTVIIPAVPPTDPGHAAMTPAPNLWGDLFTAPDIDASRSAVLFHDAFQKLERRRFVPFRGDHRLQNLPFVINGAPEVAELAIDLHKESSGPGELHPQALTDPDVSVSTHSAPTVQPLPGIASTDRTHNAKRGSPAGVR